MVGPDLRFALRQLVRNPGFTAMAVLALGLGIAATATMFAAIDAVVFAAYRGIPEADRLVQVWDRYPDTEPGTEVQVSVPNFEDYAAGQTVFERLAAFQPTSLYLEEGGAQRPVRGMHASADLLPMLGVQPLLGRDFRAEDDAEGTANLAILSHDFWQRQFGADPAIIGRVVRFAAFKQGRGGWTMEPYEIAGVLPADFRLPPLRLRHDFTAFRTPDVLLPLGLWTWGRGNRGMFAYRVVGRLRDGVTLEQSAEQLQRIASGIAEHHPETNDGYGVVVTQVRELVRAAHGRRMTILMSAAALLLLIACANVAGLLLARALARQRELAVRSAVGAARRRLLRQLLIESLLLGGVGGVIGVALAFALTTLLGGLVPPDIYGLDAIGIDPRIVGAALLVGVATSVLFGLVPGLRASGVEADQALRQAVHGSAGRRHRGFRWLVAAQVALAFVLLCGAGVLGLSLANLLRGDPGFDGQGVVLLRPSMPPGPLSGHAGVDAQVALYDRIVERIRAVPGVVGVATVNAAPLEGREPSADFTLADRPAPTPAEREYADWIFTSPDYFRVMGIPVLEGREFEVADQRYGRNQRVPGEPLPEVPAIINETMAERYWPGESALGKVFYYGIQDPETVTGGSYETGEWDERYPAPYPLRVVGVVGTAHMLGLAEEDRVQYYTLGRGITNRWWAVRVTGDPTAMIPVLQSAMSGADPEIEIARVETMDQRVRDAAAVARFQLLIVGAFGVLAALLAAIGLFGVVAFAARQRTREFGVRLALGARPAALRRLVLRQGATLAAAGLGAGLALYLGISRVMRSLLYGVVPADLRVLAGAAVLLAAAAIGASLVPARRAARLDPVRILNEE